MQAIDDPTNRNIATTFGTRPAYFYVVFKRLCQSSRYRKSCRTRAHNHHI